MQKAWDRRRNANDPRRIFANSIGRYKRNLRQRIVRKREKLELLQEQLDAQKERSRNDAFEGGQDHPDHA